MPFNYSFSKPLPPPPTHNTNGPPGSENWSEDQWMDWEDWGDSDYADEWDIPPPPPGGPPSGGTPPPPPPPAAGGGDGGTPPPPPPPPPPMGAGGSVPTVPIDPMFDPYNQGGYERDLGNVDPKTGQLQGPNFLWGGSGSGQLAAAEFGLMNEAQRRQAMIEQSMQMMWNSIMQERQGSAVGGLHDMANDMRANPWVMSSDALKQGMQNQARDRLAQAGATAKTSMQDASASSGMAGGEASAGVSGVEFKQASELAGALQGIEQEMAARRTQERYGNVQAMGQAGTSLAQLRMNPMLGFANAYANQMNPELQSLYEMYSNMGGMYAAAGLNQPYTPWQLPASQLLAGGASALGNLYASGMFNQAPSTGGLANAPMIGNTVSSGALS